MRDAPTVDSGLELLTGAEAGELMTAVLAAVDGELLEWRSFQVDHQPRLRTTVSYRARVRWADGSVTDETLGASNGELPPTVARLSDGCTEVGMWRFPFDPDLPALPSACSPEHMRRLTAEVGLGGDGPVRLQVRAYRPRRRAVLQLSAPGGTAFVKVVRPAKARALHERHRTATAAGCAVPESLGWTDDGLVLLSALPGRTLRAALVGSAAVPLDPESVVGMLDGLPPELAADGRRRWTWGQRASHYAEVLAGSIPELAERARGVAAAVDHGAEPEGPDVVVHGDFYESQLMVRDGRLSGLLDIDTAGCGERLDDAACLLGHLSVFAQLRPARADVVTQLGEALQRRFERDLPAAPLRRRTAAVVLSLATGPHRVQETDWRANTLARIALTERWLDHATASSRPAVRA